MESEQTASVDTDDVPTVTVASGVGLSQAERRRRPADTAPRAATLRRPLPEKSGAVMSRRLSGHPALPPHGGVRGLPRGARAAGRGRFAPLRGCSAGRGRGDGHPRARPDPKDTA
ncbi:hypothetical protein GCM10017778_49230 [Streptomyces vinaceus]|nr:hypothetical protein GCM10017778_49230 [Streptomyces vinaceus]